MTPVSPPAHLDVYVRILGEDMAIDFLMQFGGAELYLAAKPGARSCLVELVGVDKAAALAQADCLPRRVPTGKVYIAQVLRSKGLPVAEIARKLHTTDVTVRKYLKTSLGGRAPDDRQLPLI